MSYQPNPIVNEIPADDVDSVAIASRALPQRVSRIGFTKSLSNTVDPDWGTIVGGIGTGMDVDQTGGNLVITSGTTARSETVIRSNASWKGGVRLRIRNTLSQRIINQNFFVELVDVIGDSLAYSIGSATAITVTIPSNPFTADNIGQSIYIGLFSGTGTFLGGRYPIASIAGNDVTFTVSGFAVGTGTCSLFGWNYYQLQYQGTTATSVNFDTQRNGWASGATAATINTTASPGHVAIVTSNDLTSTLSDQLVASATAVAVTPRASRVENVPDDIPLRLQVRVQNLATAPASTTTWTIGLISISNFAPQDVSLQDIRPMTVTTGLPVDVVRTVVGPTQPVSGTVTANQGTMAALPAGANTIGQVSLALPESINDVASAAITTTTTTSAFTPTRGTGYQIVMPVTAVSGTTPTFDLSVEESDDTGTNWFTVYQFPRITATGIYRSPKLALRGNRVRYVQTIAGTTPSFTRAINRLQLNGSVPIFAQIVDRSISLTTLNSVTPALICAGASNFTMTLKLGAATTPPTLQLEGSDDGGLTYYSIGNTLVGVASSSVSLTVNGVAPLLVRARVSVVGATVTADNLLVRAF